MGNVLVYGVRHLRTRQNIYAEDGNNCHEMPANLRRETPRTPFVRATEAKAHIKDDADAALKRRSSTATQSVTGPHNHDRRVLCQKGGLVRRRYRGRAALQGRVSEGKLFTRFSA